MAGWRWVSVAILFALVACGKVHDESMGDGGMGGDTAASGGASGAKGVAGSGAASSAGPPAQAALWLQGAPAPGKICTTTNGKLGMPSKYNASVIQELACDLSRGCKPDDYVVVDRDQGSTVSCIVAPVGDNFDVRLSLVVDGSAANGVSMNFSVAGTVSNAGGTADITESNSVAQGGGSQADCTLTITPPTGLVAKGKIWASFDCPAFRDPNNIGDTGCDLSGQLLFENCN